ncbi:MAG: glycoside hydrolase family 3 C-terminal domain-containing protein [Pseudomonadota bacterium]|nr:glycoside hydrolase family 3 C-terminal domain-containing protein [Pseudomonadota bacterium]
MIAALLLAAATPAPALTLEEKAAQLQNAAPASPKLGLPAYDWWNEGLHGLARNGEATVFPQAIGLAATWDEDLMRRVGDVVATEARAKYNARPKGSGSGLFEGLTIWSPNINIFRDPRWGRGQETYGEDPVLTGRLGAAFIRGLQGPDAAHPKVIATPKHLAVHSGPEAGRDAFDVDVSPRDLEATYLPAFRTAIVDGKAQSLMCAYNSIHGVPVCASSALQIDRVRRDWGFKGLIVSDCDAVANIHLFHFNQPDPAHAAAAALKGGTDLNCGSTYGALPDAVRAGLVEEAVVDAALERAIAARRALGITADSNSPWSRIKPSQVGTRAHRALALEAARKSIVLLENRGGTLPLGNARIAVVGANADDLGVLEANYHGTAIAPVTPLNGIRKRFGAANVSYAQGSLLADGAPIVVPETALRSNGKPGLSVEVRDPKGKLLRSGQDRRIDFNVTKVAPFKAVWTGEFVPPGPGRYRLVLGGPACWHACPPHDAIRLWIGDEKRIDGTIGDRPLEAVVEGGAPVPIRVEIDHHGGDEGLRLQWIAPAEVQREEALAAARKADAIVAVVGLSPDLEGEALKVAVPGFAGGDRTEIELPRPQRELLRALEATGKPLIIVLTSGSAVALGDLKPAAVLAAWYPGEEGGTALAEILAGDINPSGRLPVTFYASTADLPAFIDYNMKERTYRYFSGTPAWSFGHGLSYTSFAYDAPVLPKSSIAAGRSIDATVTLTNAGKRAGDEVVQAYLLPPDAGQKGNLTDPVLRHMLVGFRRLNLKPNKRGSVRFTIDPRLMSSVDRSGARRVLPGEYRLWVGGGQPGATTGSWSSFTVTGNAVELPK